MSILRYKNKVMFADGGVLRDMGGGGGGGAPGASTTYNTNIPEYAKPYVTTMMGATQKQLFNTTKTGGTPAQAATYDAQGNVLTPEIAAVEGKEEITGFKPYQPYSTNVNDYFAGPSDMQRQSYQGMSNMQVAPQLAEGSIYANQAGQGMLGTTGQAGLYGAMGAMAGQNYANQATNPNSVAAYMSPYMQNVVDYQKGSALRDYAMAMPKLQAQAVGQGAFGGNRMALQQAEAGRGLMSQLQGIEAQGAQSAFDKATQAQQYGANLGLQGLGLGMQGVGAQQAGYSGALNAGTALGQLGQTQYGQQMGILQGQNQFGQQQQQMEQAKINQGIQDYATAQQYPLMQLGFMSNMLRGLPLQATTTQSYQAMPSAYQQGIGAVGTIAGAKQAGLFKEGGTVKGLAGGGAIRYADTGAVQANPESEAARGIQAQLASMDIEQLKQVANTNPSQEVRQMANELIAQKEIQAQAEQRAEQSMPQQPAMPSQGIAAAPAGSMDTLQAAGGGIIAFANRGSVSDLESDEERLARLQKQPELVGITGKPMEGYGKYIAEQLASQGDAESKMKGLNLMGIASRFGTTAGSPLYAAQQAVQGELPDIIKRGEAHKSREGQLMKGQAEIENADRLEKLGFIKEGNLEREKGLERFKDLQVANINAASHAATAKLTDQKEYAKNYVQAIRANNPEDKRTDAELYKTGVEKYLLTQGGVQQKINISRADKISGDIAEELGMLQMQINNTTDPTKKKELQAVFDKKAKDIAARYPAEVKADGSGGKKNGAKAEQFDING